MLLDTSNKAIEITLDAAPATSEAQFVAQFTDRGPTTETPTTYCGETDGTDPAEIVPPPGAGVMRFVEELIVFNADTVARTVSIRLRDNTAYFTMARVLLGNGHGLRYGRKNGWSLTPPRPLYLWS